MNTHGVKRCNASSFAFVTFRKPRTALKIGMFVNVAFATLGGSESTVPIVPKAAVQSVGNQQVVFVATKEANVFAMRPVQLGTELMVSILSLND